MLEHHNPEKSIFKKIDSIIHQPALHNDSKRENANMDGNTSMANMLQIASEGAKQYYLHGMLTEKFGEAHTNCDIHIHDLDFYGLTMTCCQIGLRELLNRGFSTGHGTIRTPQSIQSYGALAAIVLQSNQNDQHGGQSIGDFDYAMADGVKKTYAKEFVDALLVYHDVLGTDPTALIERYMKNPARIGDATTCEATAFAAKRALQKTEKATFQTMESLIHNLNSMHSRAGSQVPFSSLNYGMDTSAEGRLVIKNLLLATERGLGNGETPIFPIQVFRVKQGINAEPEDVNYDLLKLACQVSAKRLFPNFAFQDAPFNAQYYKGTPETEIAYMGCRTRVIGNVCGEERTLGRGNLSFTSINLPRIGIEAAANHKYVGECDIIDLFESYLDKTLELVLDQLIERYEVQCKRHVFNYPFLMGQGVWFGSETLGKYDEVRKVLKNGTLSIGFIGLAETLTALYGAHHCESAEMQQIGLRIVKRMRDFTDRKSKELNLNITLIATPAEGLSGRFVAADKIKYGVIPGVTDKEYYTNSFHVPVSCKVGVKEKLSLEAPYHALTNAGHISYVELDSCTTNNIDAMLDIVKHMRLSGIGYGSINSRPGVCLNCNHTDTMEKCCPKCGSENIEKLRRITGYLTGTLSRWNAAKQAEERDRVIHSV